MNDFKETENEILQILHQYANEQDVYPRSTMDLSPMEEWLILELINLKRKEKKK